MNRKALTLCAKSIAVCAALLAGAANAQTPQASGLEQGAWLQLSAFSAHYDTHVRVDSTNGNTIGSDLRLEGDLGLPARQTLARGLAGVRLGSNWRLEGEVLSLRRQGTAHLKTDIVVEDTVYAASGQVDSRFDSLITRLALGWSFLHTDTAELGLALGMHVTNFKLSLLGTARVSGTLVSQRSVDKDNIVPLPALGVYGGLVLAPGWRLGGRVDALALTARGYHGRLMNAEGQVLYHPNATIGVGLGYRFVDYRVDANTKAFSGRVDYQIKGPQVTLDLQF